jgi:hypothetical protein
MLINAFPSFKEGLTPMAAAYGLSELKLLDSTHAAWLSTPELTELALFSVLLPIENPEAHICVSFDAEWNISRNVGVSIIQIAPHTMPDTIFIIPVSFSLSLRYERCNKLSEGSSIWRKASSFASPVVGFTSSIQNWIQHQRRFDSATKAVYPTL